MKLLPVLVHPNPKLRKVAKPVTEFNSSLAELVEDMTYTMYHEKGIGLAAIQVDVPLRVIVMDLSEEKNDPKVLINPTIQPQAARQTFEEGCLSVPGIFDEVERAKTITVSAFDVHGDEYCREVSGLESACIQHEIDHLNGKLFVDYLSKLKQTRIRQKLLKKQSAA